MKRYINCRDDRFLQFVAILSASVTLTALSVSAQGSPQAVATSPDIEEINESITDETSPPPPSPGGSPSPPTPSATPKINESITDGTSPPPPSPGGSPLPPTPSATPAQPEGTPSGGQQPGAPLQRGHRHRPFPFLVQRPTSVIEQEATEGYQLFPHEEVAAAPPLHAPRPGYGPGEQILFPPNCGSKNVWALFYLDKARELSFGFPFSEGIWGTGDWFGLRHTLVDSGINIIGSYGADILWNVDGGLSPGFAYADCIDLRLDLDLERLIGWRGAHFVISCLDRNGANLSQQHIGNQFTVAQIWGDQTVNFYALWLEQDLFDGWWNLKLGRIAATDDFTSNPLIYGLYVNNAIDGQPMAVAVNGYVSAYPAAVWGARLRFNDKKHNLYAMFGVYQTTNRLYKPAYHGLDFSIRKNDGMNLLWEFGWVPEFHPHPPPASYRPPPVVTPSSVIPELWHGMPGHYKFGIFYTPWRDIPQFFPREIFYSYGFYWLFDQMVYQAVPGTDRGLTLWTAFIYSPQQNTSLMPFQFSGGFVYTGLIPYRSKDQLAYAVYYTSFSKDFAATQRTLKVGNPTHEVVLELGYRINLASYLYIEPDIQYVIRPGGTGRIPNAWVVGGQIGMSF